MKSYKIKLHVPSRSSMYQCLILNILQTNKKQLKQTNGQTDTLTFNMTALGKANKDMAH